MACTQWLVAFAVGLAKALLHVVEFHMGRGAQHHFTYSSYFTRRLVFFTLSFCFGPIEFFGGGGNGMKLGRQTGMGFFTRVQSTGFQLVMIHLSFVYRREGGLHARVSVKGKALAESVIGK